MPLDLSSLRKAVDSLERSVGISESGAASGNPDLEVTIRAGVIQNFEVAYEQSWKFIQRWIRENATPEEATHPRTRKDLFRLAAKYELIAAPEPWFEYGDARNLTSHTYDEERADEVFTIASKFLKDAKGLLKSLEGGND